MRGPWKGYGPMGQCEQRMKPNMYNPEGRCSHGGTVQRDGIVYCAWHDPARAHLRKIGRPCLQSAKDGKP